MSDKTTKTEPELVRCPKCDAVQHLGDACKTCGLIFAKYRTPNAPDPVQQPPASTIHKKPDSGVRPVHILITLVVILIAILAYKLPVQEIYADLTRTRHWTYDFSTFHKGRTQDELAAQLKRNGFDVKCREYPGVAKDDVFICQVFLTKVWGIPSNEVDLFFNRDKELTSVLFTFPADQYPAITQKLNQYGQKSNEDYGIDPDGGKIEVWKTDNGTAMTSSVPASVGIRVYWVLDDHIGNGQTASHTPMPHIVQQSPQQTTSTPVQGGGTAALSGENLLAGLPNGYKIGFSKRQGAMQITEMVPQHEEVQNWTHMVTQQVFYGGVPQQNPQQFMQSSDAAWKKTCQKAEIRQISQGSENGYPAALWLQTCQLNPITQKPEITLFKAIQGNDSFYVVQKAWKSNPGNDEITTWLQYMKQVSVCDSRIRERACPEVR